MANDILNLEVNIAHVLSTYGFHRFLQNRQFPYKLLAFLISLPVSFVYFIFFPYTYGRNEIM